MNNYSFYANFIVKRSSLAVCPKTERSNSCMVIQPNVRNPNKNVRFSDNFRTEQYLERDEIFLSEIRTVRISDVDCNDLKRK